MILCGVTGLQLGEPPDGAQRGQGGLHAAAGGAALHSPIRPLHAALHARGPFRALDRGHRVAIAA